ncbi:MAG: OmpA family protein [Bacteroidota bacterium]
MKTLITTVIVLMFSAVSLTAQTYLQGALRLGITGGANIGGEEATLKYADYAPYPYGTLTIEQYFMDQMAATASLFAGTLAAEISGRPLFPAYGKQIITGYNAKYYGLSLGVQYALPTFLKVTTVVRPRVGFLVHQTRVDGEGGFEERLSRAAVVFGIGGGFEYPLSQIVSFTFGYDLVLSNTDELDGLRSGTRNDALSVFTAGISVLITPGGDPERLRRPKEERFSTLQSTSIPQARRRGRPTGVGSGEGGFEEPGGQQNAGTSQRPDQSEFPSEDADRSRDAGADRSSNAGADRSSNAGADRSRDAGADRSRDAGADRSSNAGADRSSNAGADRSRDAGADRSRDAGADRSRDAGADRSRDAGADRSRDAGADRSRDAGADRSRDAGQDRSRDAGQDRSRDAGADRRSGTDEDEQNMTAPEFKPSEDLRGLTLNSGNAALQEESRPVDKGGVLQLSTQLLITPLQRLSDLEEDPNLLTLRATQTGDSRMQLKCYVEMLRDGMIFYQGNADLLLDGPQEEFSADRFINVTQLIDMNDGYAVLPRGNYMVRISTVAWDQDLSSLSKAKFLNVDLRPIFGAKEDEARDVIVKKAVDVAAEGGDELMVNFFQATEAASDRMRLEKKDPERMRASLRLVPVSMTGTARELYLSEEVEQSLNEALKLQSMAGPVGNAENLKVILSEVFFPIDSDLLNEEARMILDNVARLLNQHPELFAEIRGYASDVGDESYNKMLATRRAQRALEYLVRQKMHAFRLMLSPIGKEQLNSAAGDDARLGRKVEIILRSHGM